MTSNERMMALLQASDEVLAKIDAILLGKSDTSKEDQQDVRLIRIQEACRQTGIPYHTMRRIMNDGLVDTVSATGRRMIRVDSLEAFCRGERQPDAKVLERRAATNAARREVYRRNHRNPLLAVRTTNQESPEWANREPSGVADVPLAATRERVC